MANRHGADEPEGRGAASGADPVALDYARGVPGWLSQAQAEVLVDQAGRLPAGATVVEIGSHQGRSTVVLGAALPAGGRLVAVDPFPADWRYGAPDTEALLRRHLREAGVAERVSVVVATSRETLQGWSGPVDLVYVDGKHDVRSTVLDLRWARRLPPGGVLLLHDAFSSVGVTLAVLLRVLPARDLRFVSRVGSLAVLERVRPHAADRIRVLRQLPWWVRNLGVKMLLRLGLTPVARLVGHHDTADPY